MDRKGKTQSGLCLSYLISKPKKPWWDLPGGTHTHTHVIRNKVLDLEQILQEKKKINHTAANLWQILQNRNDCIYFSASTLGVLGT